MQSPEILGKEHVTGHYFLQLISLEQQISIEIVSKLEQRMLSNQIKKLFFHFTRSRETAELRDRLDKETR
jgi:hypothetical protein